MATKSKTITDMFAKMTNNKKRKSSEHSADEDEEFNHSKKPRLSIERIYQKKTQLEHVLLRPDTYIGSVEKTTQPMWIFDELSEVMVLKDITFVPGLYKIFDEILVNAADNKQRDPRGMTTIKIEIEPEKNRIMIWNNGKGIPVVEHSKEKVYVPTLIFGHLLTSSNYNDDEKKVTGGRNGYGAKLCNIFSKKFVVETSCKEYGRTFHQTWTDNMGKAEEPKLSSSDGEDFTSITFYPDLDRFKMDSLDRDIVDLFKRRAYDIVGSSRGVNVYLNKKKLKIKNFKDYVDLYTKGKTTEDGAELKVIFESVSDRWEVGVTNSDSGFHQVSFVNSISTSKGGKHVDYVTDQIVTNLIEVLKKKEKKGGIAIKPFQVKHHLWVFVNCLIENPSFDSQTKENMTLQAKGFGSTCQLSTIFYTQLSKSGVVEALQTWVKQKQQSQLDQKSGSKKSRLKGVGKLDDANDAGTKNSIDCTLILTEGDSAKTLAVSGLGVVGRDRYGVFPLKGKVLNVSNATHDQIMKNEEINNMVKIVGLQYKKKYDSPESLKTLRYGKIMIMTDQDQDGSHIKGLILNFIHHNWPHLIKQKFLEEFITPIVKVKKGNEEKSFYSLPEFEEWKAATPNSDSWKAKYYKGLGTSTAKEAKEYFSDMARHRIPFKYVGPEDDAALLLAFSKNKVEERKEWLTNWMEERKRRAAIGLQEAYLYNKDTKSITYNDFVNKELILFSNMDNERSIPSLMDGFKPGQRKVMFTCLKRNLTKEIKVAQLAGSVAEMSAYHHGEVSLMSTIIGLAQNFVGSNNLNLLLPNGQFGTRLCGGKDCASSRYINTALSPLARHIFNPKDDPLLRYMTDDNLRIEPEWYVPIIPMILVNGAEGIGTGWSTKIPNYDIREIVNNLKLMLEGREPLPMIPSFKNFRGTIEMVDNTRCIASGEVSILDDGSIEITELPIRIWTQSYKESVLEGSGPAATAIQEYKEYHTDVTVRFVVKLNNDKIVRERELHSFFKLHTALNTTCMVLFDAAGCLRKYDTVDEILKEFYELRMEFYRRRKDYLEGMLAAESLRLDNQARFIMEKIDKIIQIENVPKKDIIKLLVERKYDSDPVKAWKSVQAKLQLQAGEEEEAEEDGEDSKGPDFNYILTMQLWCLTKERKEDLLKQKEQKAEELYRLRKKTPTDLWINDLDAFVEELDKVEQKERDDELGDKAHPSGVPIKGKGKKTVTKMVSETKPSAYGTRVVPSIDDLKIKHAAKTEKGKRKKKDTSMEEDDDKKPLAERIGYSAEKSSENAKAKKPRKPREKSSPAKKGAKKGGKRRSLCSDDDSEEDKGSLSDVDFDDFDNDSYDDLKISNKPRAKIIDSINDETDVVASDNEAKIDDNHVADGTKDNDDVVSVKSDAEDDFKPTAAAKPKKQTKAAKPPAEKKKPAAKKPAAEKKAKEPSKPKAKQPAKPKAKEPAKAKPKPKAAKSTVKFSSDEEDEQPITKKRVTIDDSDDNLEFNGDKEDKQQEEEEEKVPLRERLGRSNKQQVRYDFGTDSD